MHYFTATVFVRAFFFVTSQENISVKINTFEVKTESVVQG